MLQATLFHQLGMSKADFTKLVTSRRSNGLLQLRVPTIHNKLHFFKDEIGLSDEEMRKLLVKCPRIMEHKLESTMRPHLDFLLLHGVQKEDLGKVSHSSCRLCMASLVLCAAVCMLCSGGTCACTWQVCHLQIRVPCDHHFTSPVTRTLHPVVPLAVEASSCQHVC